ncbi:MAG TPA: hypothetical protein VMR45_00560 [Patescibacteria group bacterium]|nr:hypothetical protein [Patescibacteria group bacterium]
MKIAIITCYAQNDYVRARVLRKALLDNPNVETIIIRNQNKGVLRYPEVFWKVLKCKFSQKPDVFILTFRGQDMLPFMVLAKGRKPLVFDELINSGEWLEEHKIIQRKSLAGRLFIGFYSWLIKRCRYVIADTQAHADFSAKICHANNNKFVAIPVGTDETVFNAGAAKPTRSNKTDGKFEIFYYGNGRMLPLHGWQYVFDAAVELAKTNPEVHFTLVGGKQDTEAAAQEATTKGANITYKSWIPFEKLPQAVANADLTLGGPFSKTLQSQFVVTGKTYQFLSAGVPVLIGQNLASKKFINKQNCLAVPLASTQAIINSIIWATKHPAELKQIAAEGHKLYTQNFSQKIITKQLAELLQSLES